MQINKTKEIDRSKVKIALSVTGAISAIALLGSPELLKSPMADTDIGKYHSNRIFGDEKQFLNKAKVVVKQINSDGTEIYLSNDGQFLKQQNLDGTWIYDRNYSEQKDFHLRL